jgi:threonine-phosphate decarboxylase
MRRLCGDFRDPRLFDHGGAVPGRRRGAIDFSISVNPLGPPRSVLGALRRALPDIARYPDRDCGVLTERLAGLHGVEPGQIVVANGSTDLIHRLPLVLRPRRVAIAEPTFTEYLRASLAVGARIEHWVAGGADFEPKPFDAAGADLVWLCNPNNPTGCLWPRGSLVPWIDAQPYAIFVVDEAFLPFLAEEKYHTLIPALERLRNLVVLRSLTKLYAFPGLRLGYAVLPARPTGLVNVALRSPPWSVNSLAQIAGLAALDDAEFLARTHAWLAAEHGRFVRRLAELSPDLQVVRSQANFILLRLRDAPQTRRAGGVSPRRSNAPGSPLVAQLAKRRISVRDASNFVGLDDHYIRVAVRTRAENDRLVAALSTLLQGRR